MLQIKYANAAKRTHDYAADQAAMLKAIKAHIAQTQRDNADILSRVLPSPPGGRRPAVKAAADMCAPLSCLA